MPDLTELMIDRWSRRRVLRVGALGAAAFTVPGVFAEALTQTPRMAEGPFYPDKLPLDTDNDLIRVTDDATPALGQVTHLGGKILDSRGEPVRNALVEIWQCDNNGVYLHSRDRNRDKHDSHFQSYGRFLTSSTGEYYFRTIKPVPYTGRTPHIHVKVSIKDKAVLTTQLLNVNEKERNAKDGLFKRITDEKKRAALLADFKPIEGSKIDEWQAAWDVVLGWTPADEEH
ncbi:MAG: intradiol ring-cleavage dioxygenase [Phycisphaeraceae bacterium]